MATAQLDMEAIEEAKEEETPNEEITDAPAEEPELDAEHAPSEDGKGTAMDTGDAGEPEAEVQEEEVESDAPDEFTNEMELRNQFKVFRDPTYA